MFPKSSMMSTEIAKINILEKLLKNDIFLISDLNPDLNEEFSWHDFLDVLSKDGLLKIDKALQQIRLTPKGKLFLDNYKQKKFLKVMESNISENSMIKAVLLADNSGRNFFTFESNRDYLNTLFSQLGSEVDPSMITGFFCATKGFGDSIDESGVSSIEMKGKNSQVIVAMQGKIFGIFFIDHQLLIDTSIHEILKQFLKQFESTFFKNLITFIESGLNSFLEVKPLIVKLIDSTEKKIKEKFFLQQKNLTSYGDITFGKKIDLEQLKTQKTDMFRQFFKN
jgi:predicted transcriptional regulator